MEDRQLHRVCLLRQLYGDGAAATGEEQLQRDERVAALLRAAGRAYTPLWLKLVGYVSGGAVRLLASLP
jgi:hypothetical protein